MDEFTILLGKKHGRMLFYTFLNPPSKLANIIEECLFRTDEISKETCAWFIKLYQKYYTPVSIRILENICPNSIMIDRLLNVNVILKYMVKVDFMLVNGKILSIAIPFTELIDLIDKVKEYFNEEEEEGEEEIEESTNLGEINEKSKSTITLKELEREIENLSPIALVFS